MPENDQMPPTASEQQAVDTLNQQAGESVTNEEAQALVDSGEATPGPEVTEEEKTGAPV